MKCFLILILFYCSSLLAEIPREVGLKIESNHPIASFDPRTALGGGIDGHWEGETKKIFTKSNIHQMLSAGLGPVSVRLRTELAVEAWHWNPSGTWSDPKNEQGYWTSDATPRAPIRLSYGFRLPRRGNTLDEANDDGYGMIDDGDPKSFWKSNPYLTRHYTGEADSAHPQWVVLDFGKPVSINEIHIAWGAPYARKFVVEYASTGRVYFGGHPGKFISPVWKIFSHGKVKNGDGGDQCLKLSDQPKRARYLRIWMTEGSGTSELEAIDPRDAMGYAIREIGAGVTDAKGIFHDQVRHMPNHSQTLAYASSTDPWHRASDRDPHVEQPGIDLLAQCGIARGLPLMLSIPVFYDTPENAIALAAYTQQRGIKVGRYEMGEEPDGQRVAPEDFAALYAEISRGIRNCLPNAVIGGPSFVTVDVEKNDDTYRFDHRWWIRNFKRELTRKGQLQNFQFLSFEWYPFDEIQELESDQLPRAYGMLKRAMARLKPLGLPLVVGEANYSVFTCQQEVDLGGALLNTEMASQFLSAGGAAYFFYSYEPNKLETSYADSWGNQIMLMRQKGKTIPLASYHALRLLTQAWMSPQGGDHQAYQVKSNLSQTAQAMASFFALKRPDKTWSLLVINKDEVRPLQLSLPRQFLGHCLLTTYLAKQYEWKPESEQGHPIRNHPPISTPIEGDKPIFLPAWSISVITSEKTN